MMLVYEKYSSVKEDSMFDIIKKHESTKSKEEVKDNSSNNKVMHTNSLS